MRAVIDRIEQNVSGGIQREGVWIRFRSGTSEASCEAMDSSILPAGAVFAGLRHCDGCGPYLLTTPSNDRYIVRPHFTGGMVSLKPGSMKPERIGFMELAGWMSRPYCLHPDEQGGHKTGSQWPRITALPRVDHWAEPGGA